MAKMFYRFEEAKQALNLSEEQLKQLTREGKLREFRDGAQIMYKADQVDALRGEMGLGDAVELGPSDTGGSGGVSDNSNTAGGSVISLADTGSKEDTAMDLGLSSASPDASGSGTGIAMASPGNTGSGIDLAGATGTGMAMSDPNSSGTSIGAAPIGMGSSMGSGLGGTRGGSGVSVLGLDEGGTADPSAQTAMGGSFGGEPSLDAMGSGSGLLDLSRERDDTSLGAPVLDEISGSGRSGMGSGLSGSGSSLGGSGPISNAPLTGGATASAAARGGAMPVYVEASDNFAGLAAGMAAAVSILCLVALYAVAAGAMRTQPTLLGFLYHGEGDHRAATPMLYILGGGLLFTLILGAIGFFVGKKR